MKSADRIFVPEPCPVDWKTMTPDKDGRFCSSCSKVVVDFTKKTLPEVKAYLASADKNTCGRYQVQHTVQSNKFYDLMNGVERFMTRLKLRKLGFAVISLSFLVAGCHRSLGGAYVEYRSSDQKYRNYEKTDSTHLQTRQLNNH